MNMSAKDRLFSLLFGGERELVNIKFFPGSGKDLTVDRLFEEAHSALQQALDPAVKSTPPQTGRKPALLRELLAAR